MLIKHKTVFLSFWKYTQHSVSFWEERKLIVEILKVLLDIRPVTQQSGVSVIVFCALLCAVHFNRPGLKADQSSLTPN